MSEYAVRGKCIRCRDDGIDQPFVFVLGDARPSSEDAAKIIEDSSISFSCPGGGITPHVEISPLKKNVDFGDFEVFEYTPDPNTSDLALMARLAERYGKENLFVISPIEGLDLPLLPSGLSHIGFGEFEAPGFRYCRNDTPSGRRIYVR
jgi:hypothetical protein